MTYDTPIDSGKFITMFADASYCHKSKIAGWAVWIKYDSPAKTERISGVVTGVANSTEAEFIALEKGQSHIINYLNYKDKIVVMQSDCLGALDKIKLHINVLKRYAVVRYKHVKGHQGFATARSSVNTWCDEEARRQMRKERDKE